MPEVIDPRLKIRVVMGHVYAVRMPYTEVMMHMQLADKIKLITVTQDRGGYHVYWVGPDNNCLQSTGCTISECGLYRETDPESGDAGGLYYFATPNNVDVEANRKHVADVQNALGEIFAAAGGITITNLGL